MGVWVVGVWVGMWVVECVCVWMGGWMGGYVGGCGCFHTHIFLNQNLLKDNHHSERYVLQVVKCTYYK